LRRANENYLQSAKKRSFFTLLKPQTPVPYVLALVAPMAVAAGAGAAKDKPWLRELRRFREEGSPVCSPCHAGSILEEVLYPPAAARRKVQKTLQLVTSVLPFRPEGKVITLPSEVDGVRRCAAFARAASRGRRCRQLA
jgi:hypothetical protein